MVTTAEKYPFIKIASIAVYEYVISFISVPFKEEVEI